MLYQIIYSSQASTPMTAVALEQILVDAREGNVRRQVTGVLIYVDGMFLQVLEGEHAVLSDLVKSIEADTRHRAMKVFHEAPVSARAFGDWRMAYLSPDLTELASWAGLKGTQSIASLVQDLHGSGGRVPRILVRLVDAIAAQ